MTGRLVGREGELLRVEPLFSDLMAGRGGLVLITGEPGIGKTRFAEELSARLRGQGVRTAWASAWPDAGTPPLWMWQQALDQLVQPADVLDTLLPSSPDEADEARFAQFAWVATAIRAAAEVGPVAIVLDDLQWADRAALRLLAFVAGALRDVPCLLVGVARDGELGPEDLLAITRLGSQLTLGGLAPEGVRDLLAMSVDDSVAEAVHEVVTARSGGNPLFVGEFGRLLRVSGRTEVVAAAVPPVVAAVLQRRMARLSEQVVGSLQAAAVLGKEFGLTSVQRLVAHDGTTDVRSDIDVAAREGLVTRLGRERFAFAHDLIRDVALDSLPDERRARLHLAAADLVRDSLQLDPGLRTQLALHLEEAGERAEARDQWEAAASWHLGRLGFEQAATWFARAASLTPDPIHRTDLLLAEADARLRAGELALARSRFTEAADLAHAVGDGTRLVAAVLGIGAGAAAWEVPISDPTYTRLIEEALAQLGPDAGSLRSSLLARLSVASATPETLERSRALAEEARELARATADQALEAQALAALCDALAGPAHVRQRLGHSAEIMRLADEAGHRLLGLLGARFRVVALLELGQFSEVDSVITDFERRTEELRQPLLSWYVPLFRGMRALLKGHLAEAEQHLSVVVDAAERTGSTNARLLSATLGIGIDAARGRVTDPSIMEGIVDVDPAVWASYAGGVGYLALRAGDLDRARTLLRLHSDNGFARVGDDAEHLATLTFFGRMAIALDEQDAAALVYEALRPFAGMWVVDGIGAVCWAPVELELARLATALGLDEARGHLELAAATTTLAGARVLDGDVADLRAGRGPGPAQDLEHRDAAAGPPHREGFRNAWLREGEFWTLSYAGRTVRMKHAKGFADLAVLLAAPAREVHVADLYGDAARRDKVVAAGDLGEVLDAAARQAYRQRLEDLEDEVEDARTVQDLGRVEQLSAERDFVAAELSAALGLGGRPRRAGDPNERFRKAVGMRIKLAIDRLVDPYPELAAHLRNSVRTGLFCSYVPETPVDWHT